MGQQGPARYWKVRGPRPGTAGRADPFQAVNYADLLALGLIGGGGGGGLPPLLNAGVGLERNGVTVDLLPATETGEIGGINEPPADGQQYARFWDGAQWSWIPASAVVPPATDTILGIITEPAPDGLQYVRYFDGAAWAWAPTTAGVEFGDGLTVDRTQTPPIVNLQPATDFSIGGIKEPPQTAPDQKDYVRRFNPALPEGWEWAESTAAEYNFARGLEFDETTRDVNLDPAGPTNMGGVIVPVRDATSNGLAIDMGDAALGDPATGELRAPPATDLLLGSMLEPPPDGISYVRQFDLTGQFWTWVEAATAGLQINAVIPDEVKFGPTELDVLVHCYGQHFTPTCVLYASDGINPAQPLASSAYVNATEMTFLATPNQITAEILYTITVQDPAAVAPDPVLGAGAEPFRYVESLKVAGETIDRLGIVYVPPDQGLQVAPDGALAARIASDSKHGVILDAPFGQATWVRHGEGRWIPAPLPTPIAGHVPDDAGKVFVPERTQGQGLTLADDGGLYLRPATDQHLGGILEPSERDVPMARVVDPVTGLGGWEEVTDGMEEPPMQPVALWGRSNGGDRGWLPIPEQEPGMEEPPMSPVALWARSSGGARGWLEIPEPPPGMEEPPHDPVAVWGRTSAGDRGWAEVPTFDHLEGFVEKRGDTMQGFLTLHAQPEHPFHAATKDYVDLSEPQEAPHNGKLYARQDGQWVEIEEPQAPMEEPPASPVALWVRSSAGARGWIELPDASQSIEEPPADPVAIWGRSSAGARGWLEVPTFDHLDGFVSKIGDTMTGPLTLYGPPTQPLHAATLDWVDLNYLKDAPNDGKSYAREGGQWVEVEETSGIEEPPASPVALWGRSSAGARGWIEIPQAPDNGMEEPPAEPVAIWGRSSAGARGWIAIDQTGVQVAGDNVDQLGVVYVPDKRGLQIGPDGALAARIATDLDHGVILDAPANPIDPTATYVRKFGQWVENEAVSSLVPVGRSPENGLENGYDDVLKAQTIWVPLATDTLAGSIVEPPVDGKQYSRVNDAMAGAPAWVENTAKGVAVGDVPPTGPSPGDLWFESDSGSLFVFYDDGDSAQWVETGSGSETKATIEIGDAPPPNPTIGQFWWNSVTGQTFIWYDDGTSTQWVQIAPGPEGGGGTGGAVDEAPLDGLQYGRQNGLWTEVVTSYTTISDTPPVNPQIADLWFQGTTLDTFIYYDDGSGPIWIQQNTPADFTGYATETWVQTEISNAIIDAQAFTRAATEAVGHNTDACEKALAAVEKLSGAVTQLQAGHHALKKRIASLEKRLH